MCCLGGCHWDLPWFPLALVSTLVLYQVVGAIIRSMVATPTKVPTKDLIKVPTTWDSTRLETKARRNQGAKDTNFANYLLIVHASSKIPKLYGMEIGKLVL